MTTHIEKLSLNKPYDTAENALADKIARATNHEFKTVREVGGIVEEWMQHVGAKPQWGTSLVARIAKHPKLDVSRQYIYQCWHTHRLVEQHGRDLAQFKLHDSALVQLSRITQAKDLDPEEQRHVLLTCAEKVAKEKLPVDAVRREVSLALRAKKIGEPKTIEEICIEFKCKMEVAAAEVEKIEPHVAKAASEAELTNLVAGVECILATAVCMFAPLSERAVAVAPALAARLATKYEKASTKLAKMAARLREGLTAVAGNKPPDEPPSHEGTTMVAEPPEPTENPLERQPTKPGER